MHWWSTQYTRPLKDPILLSYTLEELTYEFYIHTERILANKERVELENDKIEEAKRLEDEKWADEMEAEETAQSKPPSNEEKQWMDKVISENKQEFGESFGENLSLDFGTN